MQRIDEQAIYYSTEKVEEPARAGVKLFDGKELRGGGSKNYHKKQDFRKKLEKKSH